MKTNTTPGLNHPGLRDAQTDNHQMESELSALIEQHERTDWSAVPGVSVAEASAWTARLIEARDAALEGL